MITEIVILFVAYVLIQSLYSSARDWWSQKGYKPIRGDYRVIDGDTIAVGDERIRLQGIDAPEIGQTGGDQATEALRLILAKGRIRAKLIERDKYGRAVGALQVNGKDVCAAMVSMGMARSYGAYKAQERIARLKRRGLWGAPGGMADPTAFRRLKT